MQKKTERGFPYPGVGEDCYCSIWTPGGRITSGKYGDAQRKFEVFHPSLSGFTDWKCI